jgi:hypothetical protein
MKNHVILILFSILFLCNETYENLNTIRIGEFTFQFPNDFKLINEQGIDSYVGKVSNGKIRFQFDYGYYSDSFDPTIEEYLNEDVWKWNALGKLSFIRSETDISKITKEIILLKSITKDSINFTNYYKYGTNTLSYEIIIPEEIRSKKITIDTIDNVIIKIVKGKDNIGLYAKNLKNYSKSMKASKALSIFASNLNRKDVVKALKILKTCTLEK